MDNIINFGENLPQDELNQAMNHSKKSDLALVLGTSMVVQPACLLPANALKNRGHMVIINKQKTPFDKDARLTIRADLDDVMFLLMLELNLTTSETTSEGLVVRKPDLDIEGKHKEFLVSQDKLTKQMRESVFQNVLKDQKVSIVSTFQLLSKYP